MPKAKSFNSLACILLIFGCVFGAEAQPLVGQMIEQTKKNKLEELLLLSGTKDSDPLGQKGSRVRAEKNKDESQVPALWSLTGINDAMIAEVVIENEIHKFKVDNGRMLPGGWIVKGGDSESITLQLGKRVQTIFAPTSGSSGAEYSFFKKIASSSEGNSRVSSYGMAPGGLPIEFINPPNFNTNPGPSLGPDSNKNSASMPISPIDAARNSAASLPKRP